MIYRIIRLIAIAYLKIFNRWEIEGAQNIPSQGPVVLVANHVSQWDPVVLGCSVQRTVHYMAKEELFKIPVVGKLLPLLLCFPVKRGKADRNALRMAAKYLENGEILGLFPEGTRSKTAEMLPFQPGAALFALRSAAPIVPVALIGTKTTFPNSLRGKLKVVIGQPLTFPELYGQKIGEAELERVSAEVKEKIRQFLQKH